MVKKKKVGLPEPKLQEISFSGNMPPVYEKNLQKDLKKSATKLRRKK